MAYTKKWNGSAWVTAPVKRWNGSSWVDAYTYKWNGSKWVQLYPDTAVTQSYGWESGDNKRSWREAGYEAAGENVAKQGPYGSYTPAYGYLDISSAPIPGSKNITDIDYLDMVTTRGGAGEYNKEKTIYFYRSANAPTAVPTLLGSAFTAIAEGVGANIGFSGSIDITSHTKNWANQVNNGKYLWIYTSSASHYLSLGPIFKLEIGYTFTAATAAFVDETSPARLLTIDDNYNDVKNMSYHTMTIYDDEVDLSLMEIMQRREDGIVEDIKPSNVYFGIEIKPWFREYEVFIEENVPKFKIEAMNLNMETQVQYSLDTVNWDLLYGTGEGTYVQTDLPLDFNKYKDNIYVRIVDTEKEEIVDEIIIEPIILIS